MENQTKAVENAGIEAGDYVVGNYGDIEGVLYQVKKTFERDDGETQAVVETVLSGRKVDTESRDVRAFDPAEEFEGPSFKSTGDLRRRTRGGVHIYEDEDEFCPVCGSNARRWGADPDAGIGGEWCETCGFEFESF